MVVSTARLRALSRKWLPLLVWAIVAVAVFFGLRQTIVWAEVRKALFSADVRWLLFACFTIALTQWLKAIRWRVLLQVHDIYPSLSELLKNQLTGQGLNTFLPVRLGEVARIQSLKRYDRTLIFSSITIEKSADLACFVVMALALTLVTNLPEWLTGQFRLFAVTTTIGIMILGVVLIISRDTWLTHMLGPGTVLRPVLNHYKRFRTGWQVIARPRDAITLIVLSASIWSTAIVTNVCLLAAFALPLSWVSATALLVVLQIGITVVTLPATIGIFEYLCVMTLAWFGVPQSVAFSLGVVLHLLVLVPSVAGIVFARPKGSV